MSRSAIASRAGLAVVASAFVIGFAGCSQAPAPVVVGTPAPPPRAKPMPEAAPQAPLAGAAVTATSGTPRPASVAVVAGDTLYALSRRYDVPIRDLIVMNHLAPPYLLRVGQRIELPRSRYHAVRKGETAYAVSRLYDVDLHSLMRLNRIEEPYTISIGQRLLLPGTTTPVSAPVTRASKDPPASPAPPPTVTVRPVPDAPPPPPVAAATPSPAPSRDLVRVPRAPPRAGALFAWPVEGKVISRFGPKSGGRHNDGINIAAAQGTPLRAAENGVVAYAGNELKGFGNLLLLRHADGWSTAYAHAEVLLVQRGEAVRKGQIVGRIGNTGAVGRPQLHFEIRRGAKALDPLEHLEFRTSGGLNAPGSRPGGRPDLG